MANDFPIHVSILATPETYASPVVSIFDVLNLISDLHDFDNAVPDVAPYHVEIVSENPGEVMTASRIPILNHRPINEIARTDIVVIPSIIADTGTWRRGQHPQISMWLRRMHDAGAMICTTCTGVFLLSETGLLDCREATMHWTHAKAFQRAFPDIKLNLEEMLVITGGRSELTMSVASTSWQDLVLYLVARHVSKPAAYAVAKFFAMQWHAQGQSPFIVFTPALDHGDTVIFQAQQWLHDHFAQQSPVDALISQSGMPTRTFKRRFSRATGLSPIHDVQNLRIDHAKRWLERSTLPVDGICWKVGYEDAAFFRRLFKRLTAMTPAAYRRSFTLPQFEA